MKKRILNKRLWKKKNMRVIQSLNRNKVKVKKFFAYNFHIFLTIFSMITIALCALVRKVKKIGDTVAVKEFLNSSSK